MWKKTLKKLSKSINYLKIRHHCHYTGKCRSAAHSICNAKFNVSNEIPVVFHNDSNYDCHSVCTGKCSSPAHSICNAKFDVPNEIPVVFHNGSNYDCHSVINELENKFEENFECLGEKELKVQNFPSPNRKRCYKNR